jgi:hypothetical protein
MPKTTASNRAPIDLQRQLSDLSIILNFANASFELWWSFCNIKFVEENRRLIDDLDRFFYYTRESNLFSFVVRICVLFDKPNSAQSLESTYTQAKKQNVLSPSHEQTINDLLTKAKPVWFSLEDPRGKKFDWPRHNEGCSFIKVKAIAPPEMWPGNDEWEPKLAKQRLLIVDTLGQNYLIKPDGDDHAPQVEGDGHIIEVVFSASYTYPEPAFGWKKKPESIDFQNLKKNKNETLRFDDRDHRNITIEVMGRGEAPPTDQVLYVCLWGQGPIQPQENTDGATPPISHFINAHFETVE